MDYYDNDWDRERRISQADASLRRQGFVRDAYVHYDDPNNVTRTGAHIDHSTGAIHRDM